MKTYLSILFLAVCSAASAQQISLNSQYLFNEMLVNPGATGIKEYIPVQVSFRKQWVSFPGAPTTQAVSSHAAVAKNMGFGGTFFNDVAGPSRRTGVNINGAYHLRLDERRRHKLGFGLGLSFTQNTIDENLMQTYLPDDPAVIRGFNNVLVPDANFGIFYRFLDKGFAGLSAHNLVEMNRDLYDFEAAFVNSLVRNYYFFGGYNFELGQKWELKPTTLVQMIETGTVQFEGTLIATFNRILWFGGSYRHGDAAVAMVGAQAGPFRFGYSYDFTLSDIADYSTGSHEVFLELQLWTGDNASRTPWLQRNRIFSPRI